MSNASRDGRDTSDECHGYVRMSHYGTCALGTKGCMRKHDERDRERARPDEHDLRAKVRQICINFGLHCTQEDEMMDVLLPLFEGRTEPASPKLGDPSVEKAFRDMDDSVVAELQEEDLRMAKAELNSSAECRHGTLLTKPCGSCRQEATEDGSVDPADELTIDAQKLGLYDMVKVPDRIRAQIRAETIEECAKVVDKQASIRRMRAQSFADDSDRADGEAQTDDIEREESIAEALDYTASRVRDLASPCAGEKK